MATHRLVHNGVTGERVIFEGEVINASPMGVTFANPDRPDVPYRTYRVDFSTGIYRLETDS